LLVGMISNSHGVLQRATSDTPYNPLLRFVATSVKWLPRSSINEWSKGRHLFQEEVHSLVDVWGKRKERTESRDDALCAPDPRESQVLDNKSVIPVFKSLINGLPFFAYLQQRAPLQQSFGLA
jgi:hypothetical protein